MLSDDALRHEMAKKAIVNVRRFELSEIAERWKNLYDTTSNKI
jgi:hypothetical protein